MLAFHDEIESRTGISGQQDEKEMQWVNAKKKKKTIPGQLRSQPPVAITRTRVHHKAAITYLHPFFLQTSIPKQRSITNV